MEALEKTFSLRERQTTVGRELLGGLTTFMALSYIVFVQPALLSQAKMPQGGVLVATCLASAAACLLMAFLANYPIALAPAMGHNVYFVFGVCLGMAYSWQQGLAAVFVGGCVFVLLSLFGFRARIMELIPDGLKRAIAGGIGLLLTLIGLEYAGLVVDAPGVLVKFGNVHNRYVLLAVFGLAVTLILLAFKVRGAILYGIVTTALAGCVATAFGYELLDYSGISLWTLFDLARLVLGAFAVVFGAIRLIMCARANKIRDAVLLGVLALAGLGHLSVASLTMPARVFLVTGAAFYVLGVLGAAVFLRRRVAAGIGAALAGIAGAGLIGLAMLKMPDLEAHKTAFALDFRGLFTQKGVAAVILTFLFLDVFDTVGTLVGVGERAGLMKEGKLPRARPALFSDAAGTVIGSLLGTSTITSYVESAAGIQAGARTGLANVATAGCFLLAILLHPFLGVVASPVGEGGALYPVIAPALVVVGSMMLVSVSGLKWEDPTELLPAFLTLVLMAFAVSITEGIAAGFIAYSVLKLVTGRGREVHWGFHLISLALVLRYIFLKG